MTRPIKAQGCLGIRDRDARTICEVCRPDDQGIYRIKTVQGEFIPENYEECASMVPSLVKTGFQIIIDRDARTICEVCRPDDQGIYRIKTVHGEFIPDNYEECASMVPSLVKTGFQIIIEGRGGSDLSGCHKKDTGISGTNDASAADLAKLVPEEYEDLRSYLMSGPGDREVHLIKRFGIEKTISLSRIAKDRTAALIRNLALISHLISSDSDLKLAAEAVLGYIDAVRVECPRPPFSKSWTDKYADLSIISKWIRSIAEIEQASTDLATLASLYCPMLHRPFYNPHDKFMRLAPAIERHGAAPLAAVAKSSGKRALEWISRSGAQALIDRIGMEEFVKMAGQEGESAIDLFGLFTNRHVQPVIDRHGIAPILFLFNEAKKTHGSDAAIIIEKIFSVASHLPVYLSEIRETFPEILKITSGMEHNSIFWLESAIKLFKEDISSMRDLLSVTATLIEYGKRSDSDMRLVMNVLKESGASAKSDLEKGFIHHLEEAAKKTDDDKILVTLVRNQTECPVGCVAAFSAMDDYERRIGRRVDEFAEMRFKCAFKIIQLFEEDRLSRNIKLDSKIVPRIDRIRFIMTIRAQFEAVRDNYRGSKFSSMAQIMCNVLHNDEQSLELRTVSKGAGVTVKRFRGLDDISLVYVGKEKIPEIIPGKARVSKGMLVIPKFDGKYRVVFKKPAITLPRNSEALLEAIRILPESMFYKLDGFVFTDDKLEREGSYGCGTIYVHRGHDKLGTIVHELAHHWDLFLTVNASGGQGGFGDESQIFYDISWKGIDRKREIDGSKFGKVKMDRDDFDKDDFVSEYGMCNREEDIATMFEAYVTKGPWLRKRVREQMDKGNFELAAKYLFVRYVGPFNGREYGISNDSIGFEEVLDKYREFVDCSRTRIPDTYNTIMKIKGTYEYKNTNL